MATSGATMKVKVNGVNKLYRKSSCHSTKGAAKVKAISVRNGGKTARVLKSGKAYCVYVGPTAKAPFGKKRKKTTTKKTTPKRIRRTKR